MSLSNHCAQWRKQPDYFDEIFPEGKSIVEKTFAQEMVIRALPITLLRVFCRIILNSELLVLVKIHLTVIEAHKNLKNDSGYWF